MGAVDVASEKLRFVVEAELPAPIARDFARVAGAHGVAAGPIAANLLGALLRHAAFVLSPIGWRAARRPSSASGSRPICAPRRRTASCGASPATSRTR